MLADTGASHNYVAGDFLEFLQKNGTRIRERKHGPEVIQTTSGEITTTSKLVTLPLIIARQQVMLKAFALDLHEGCDFSLIAGLPFLQQTRAEFFWHDDKLAPGLKLQINGCMIQVSCDMCTEDSATKVISVLETQTPPPSEPNLGDWTSNLAKHFPTLFSITCWDAYPIPHANDSLNLLAGSRYFTSLDFLNRFWQIPMKEAHKGVTAFSCRYGHFEWNIIPMGLTNVPAMFQQAMNNVLVDFIDQCCIVYLDDIIVFSPDLETHKKDVDKVCAALKAAGFVLSLHKCHFAKKEVKMLGHIINDGKTIMLNPAKVKVITTWPFPADIISIRGFLNVCRYYRCFIKGFTKLADPLYELTEGSPQKRAAINMTEPRKRTFNELKAAVQNTVLGLPQLNKHYYIELDASDTAIGAVLSQVHHDWQGWQSNDKELPPKTPGGFTWVTDHKGIVYFRTQHELTPYDNDKPSDDLKQVLVTTRRPALIGPSEPTTLERLTTEETNSKLAIKPGMAEAVAKSITCEGHPTWLTVEQKALSIMEMVVQNSVSAKEALLSVDMGGLNDGDVAQALQKVEHWVLQMDAFERWGLDFLSLPSLRSGNSKLITAIDYCTGQAHAFPTKNENTADALRMMEQLIYRYGKLSSVVCDNGSAWTSYGFRDYMRSLGIRIIYIAPYHPQTNGKVERFNGILLNALKRYDAQHQLNWDDPKLLDQVLFGYRATRSEMTGESPFFMMYGRHPRFRLQATDNASDDPNASRNYELEGRLARARRFDKFRTSANIAVGDIVLARNRLDKVSKYDPPWSGPYLVSSISVEGAAELVSRRGRTLKSTINVSDLKLAHGPSADRSHWFPWPPPQQSSFIGETDLRRWDAMEAGDTQSSSNEGDPPASPPLRTTTVPLPRSSTHQPNSQPTARATTTTPVPRERVNSEQDPPTPMLNDYRHQAGLPLRQRRASRLPAAEASQEASPTASSSRQTLE
ncbi:uncharacterized protein UBRO_20717 [Ustilago bromivora]|uniref:Reverse transcriptase n=1 Tax=Ustilago bromivora TaxID=307758 RepID=A0A1K0H5K8_9BASI|nr:uncharacterized protein UBRO_20717 [Ustilago bromivora]SYW80246.1 uncharacterized protein UBRO2_03514 [Ustilago bromivora]